MSKQKVDNRPDGTRSVEYPVAAADRIERDVFRTWRDHDDGDPDRVRRDDRGQHLRSRCKVFLIRCGPITRGEVAPYRECPAFIAAGKPYASKSAPYYNAIVDVALAYQLLGSRSFRPFVSSSVAWQSPCVGTYHLRIDWWRSFWQHDANIGERYLGLFCWPKLLAFVRDPHGGPSPPTIPPSQNAYRVTVIALARSRLATLNDNFSLGSPAPRRSEEHLHNSLIWEYVERLSRPSSWRKRVKRLILNYSYQNH